MHELGHGFVFKTKWLNGLFMRILSFVGWLHPDMFFSSHFRCVANSDCNPHGLQYVFSLSFSVPNATTFETGDLQRRHHRFTQNAPHDQENPMPVLLTPQHFLEFGFINFKGGYSILSETVKAALGIYPTGHLGWLPGWEDVSRMS